MRTLALLFTAAAVPSAAAQDIQVLLTTGDVIPGVGTIDNGFSSPFIRCRVDDAGEWMVQFEYDNSNNDAVMRSGTVILQDGDAAPGGLPVGATITEFDSWSINNVGDIVWGLRLDGTTGTTDDSALYVNNTLIAQEGSTPPGTWGAGTVWLSFDEARVTNDLSTLWVVGRNDDPTTTATGSDYYGSLWSLDGSLNLVGESVLARGFETLTGMVAPEEVNTLGVSFDGQGFNNLGHVMFRCSIRNAMAGDAAVYMNTVGTGGANNTVMAFEGVTEPATGQPWGSLTAPELDLNDNGDWMIKDQVASPTTDVIIVNGAVFKQDGDTHPDFGAETIAGFGNVGAKLTDNGDVMWFGDFSGSTTTDNAFFLNDTLLVREGVTMTNGGGLIDELRGFNSTNAISPNGRWLIFECEVNNVDSVCLMDLDASPFASVCNGDGGDQLGCTDCPCGNNATAGTTGGCLNSSGNGTNLIASGSASVSLPSGDTTDLRFGTTGQPANAFGVLLSGDAVAPTNMANPCFGLNSGTQAFDRDGLRCAVGTNLRHGGRTSDANGEVGVTTNPWGGEGNPAVGIAGQAGFVAGQTRYFQLTHRDDPLLVCMRGLNTSQAVEVTFEP